MTLGSKNRDNARYNAWASCKLILTDLVEAERPDCIGNGLDELKEGSS